MARTAALCLLILLPLLARPALAQQGPEFLTDPQMQELLEQTTRDPLLSDDPLPEPEPQAAATARPAANPDVARQIEAFDQIVPPGQEILPPEAQHYCVSRWQESEYYQRKCLWENRQALKRVTMLYLEMASGSPIVEAQFDVCRRRFFPDFRLVDYCISKELGLSLE